MAVVTIRERMLKVYGGERPDCIPVSAYGRYLPRGTIERELRSLGVGVIEWHPVMSPLGPPRRLEPGNVSQVQGADLSVGLTFEHGQPVEVRTYETPLGTLSQRVVKEASYGSAWIREHYIKQAEDYRIMQYLVENTVFRSNEEDLRSKRADLGEDGVVLGRFDRSPYQKLLLEFAGPERFLTDYLTDPGPVVALLRAMETKMEDGLRMIAETPAEVIWQPENITADMTPPKYYEKHCLPFYHKVADVLKGSGKPYIAHMDGRLKPLKDLIAQSPFSAVESFSLPEVGGDMTLSEAAEAWPGKAILPSFPSSLCLRDTSEIAAFLERFTLEAESRGGPYMLQVSEDLPVGEYRRVLPIVCQHLPQTRSSGPGGYPALG